MENLKESSVVQALLRPPLFLGVPRWFLSVELVLIVCAWMGAGMHWSSWVVTGVVFLFLHPFVAWKSRDNPWTVVTTVRLISRTAATG